MNVARVSTAIWNFFSHPIALNVVYISISEGIIHHWQITATRVPRSLLHASENRVYFIKNQIRGGLAGWGCCSVCTACRFRASFYSSLFSNVS